MPPDGANGTSPAPIPYRRGWRAPWQGQWGGFQDGHTRLSYLARRIERELRRRFTVGEDPVSALLVRQAARQGALAEALAAELLLAGDPRERRAAQRRWTASVEGFRRALRLLEAASGKGHGPTTIEALIAGMKDPDGR